jgi:hypothetical protein
LSSFLPDFDVSREGLADEDEFAAGRESVGLYTAYKQVLLVLQCYDALLGGGVCFLFHSRFVALFFEGVATPEGFRA